MEIVARLVLLSLAFCPASLQDLPVTNLNVGVILNSSNDIVQTVLGLAIETANVELKKFNYALQLKTETLDENPSFNAIRKVCNLLQSGIVTLIDPLSTIQSFHISSLCSKYHIPHIITSCQFPESANTYPMDVRMSPSCDQFANILYHYISQIEVWNEMILIYSSDNCILKFEYLLNQFESHFTMRQWVYNDVKKKKQLFRELSKSKKYRHFLVDIPYWQITDFLIMASVHNFSDPQYSFIFSDWDTGLLDLAMFKINNQMNITSFSVMNQTLIDELRKTDSFNNLLETLTVKEKSYQKKNIKTKFMNKPAILLDSIQLLVQSIIQLSRVRPITVNPINCSSNIQWNLGSSFFNSITSVENVNGITGKIVFNENFLRKEYNLSVLALTENGFTNSGFWDGNKFVIFEKHPEPDEKKNKNIRNPLRVTTIVNLPFVRYKDEESPVDSYDTNIDSWEGFCIDLLAEIGVDLGLNFTIHLVKDGTFGTIQPNQTNPDGSEKWNGMIGELISNEADLVMAPMTISYEREKVVDFTTPFMSVGLSILFLRPQKEAPRMFSFLSPLSPPVWGYVISAYIGVSVLIFLVAHITPYEWFQIHPGVNLCSKHNQFNLLNSLWFSVGALVRQGLEFCPQSSSTRMISGAWWFFTLIIISTYTANLAAFLTVEQLILPIKSAEDLIKQTAIKYGTLRGGASEAFFEKSSIETYSKMYSFMKANPGVFVNSTLEGIDKVRNSKGKYAFLLESAMNDYYTQRDCSLMRVGDMLDSKGYGIGFPAGSPLRDKMTKSILKLQKSQKLANLIHKWWKEINITEPCDTKEKGSAPASLNVDQVGGVFFLLGAGFICAAFVSIIELYVNFYQRKTYNFVSFRKYLKNELRFAMRFMSSSKKPLSFGTSSKSIGERFVILAGQLDHNQDAMTNISQSSEGLQRTIRIAQFRPVIHHVSTDLDISHIQSAHDSFSSRDTL